MSRDTDLVRRSQQGELEAFSRLVELHWCRLVGLARSILGDADAEDAVQDGFIVAWDKLKRLRQPGAFAAWITRIIARSCVRRARKQGGLSDLSAVAEPCDPRSHGAIETIHVAQILGALAPRQRAVMYFTVVAGMSDTEIGSALGITAASVRSHRRRARERLQQVLARQGG